MDMGDASKQIEALREQIRDHDHRYYVMADPVISDQQYDQLLKELQELERKHPEYVTPDSPTQRVGGTPIEGFEHVQHAIPMLSVDNTYDEKELREFDGRVRRGLDGDAHRYVVDPKVDGVAASVRYESGRMVRVATRGDGRVGDDITHTAKTVRSIPLRLHGANHPSVIEVRGEIYWPLGAFHRFNDRLREEGKKTFANPRNATAGTLKQLDPRSVADRGLAFLAYGFGTMEGLIASKQSEIFIEFQKWGLPVSEYFTVAETIDDVVKLIHQWQDKRLELDYQIDGMVIKVDDLAQRAQLGTTSKYPRWCIAYKFSAEQVCTQLKKVIFQVGKLGTITPVADLEPVLVSGTTVKRASLHNFDQVERLGVRVGDRVVIEKAGEIIPQVVGVDTESRPARVEKIRPPATCPECGGEVVRDPGGVYLRCINPSCPAQVRERLIHFCGRDQMDIEGIGPALIDQLIGSGLVRRYADFFHLHEHRDKLLQLERMGAKSADNILAALDDARHRPLSRLLASLNIPHVGLTTAQLLASEFGNIDALTGACEEQLLAIHGIGPELAQSLHTYFDSKTGRSIITDLKDAGVNMTEPKTSSREPQMLKNRVIVVTGTLERFSRKEIEALIADLGGKTTGSVSRNTDFVVCGEEPGSKYDKAVSLGVEILSEEDFLKRIGRS